jgi:hypothetical protein
LAMKCTDKEIFEEAQQREDKIEKKIERKVN